MDRCPQSPQSSRFTPTVATLPDEDVMLDESIKAVRVYLGGEKISTFFVSRDAVPTLKLLYPDCHITY